MLAQVGEGEPPRLLLLAALAPASSAPRTGNGGVGKVRLHSPPSITKKPFDTVKVKGLVA